MNTRCEEMKVLLPWLVNESLQSTEKLSVLNHLAVCPGCRKELAFIINIRNAAVSNFDSELNKQAAADLFAQIAYRAVNRAAETDGGDLKLNGNLAKEIIKNPAPLAVMSTVLKGVKHLFGNEAMKINTSLKPVADSLRLYASLVEAGTGRAG